MSIGGILFRTSSTSVRFLEFLACAAILGIFSYFLSCLHSGGLAIPTWMRAVEGLAGAATLYTLLAVLLTFFLGGIIVFAFLGIILDILFIGAFIYVAYENRGAARNCGTVTNEAFFGTGVTSIGNSSASPRVICDLQKTVFILAIILWYDLSQNSPFPKSQLTTKPSSLLFLISAIVQLLLGKHSQKEKRYGPGPSNNYTAGSGKRSRFGRRAKAAPVANDTDTHIRTTRDVEAGTAMTDMRPSADTAVTDQPYGGTENKYFEQTAHRANERGLEGNLQRGPDVQAQPAYGQGTGAIHLEPAVHGNSRYEAEKYGEELHV